MNITPNLLVTLLTAAADDSEQLPAGRDAYFYLAGQLTMLRGVLTGIDSGSGSILMIKAGNLIADALDQAATEIDGEPLTAHLRLVGVTEGIAARLQAELR